MEYDISFDNIGAKEKGLYVVKRPNIPAPRRKYTETEVPGRDGKMYLDEGTVEDIEIEIEFNFIGNENEWFERFRNAKRWLLEKGKHKLCMGDDEHFFYLCKRVQIDTAERVCYEIGKFTVTFICSGYAYLKSGELPVNVSDFCAYNPYEESHPIYEIRGEGICDITVNGETVKVNVSQNIVINTELMMTYREDGEIKNTELSGDYENLYLRDGENSIKISNGFEAKIIPNWRCL